MVLISHVIVGYLKLSLKKSRLKATQDIKKLNRSSDVIILDESFDRLKSDSFKTVSSSSIYFVHQKYKLKHRSIISTYLQDFMKRKIMKQNTVVSSLFLTIL